MSIETERTNTRNKFKKDTEDNSYDPHLSKYDFEIKLAKWKRVSITILNIFTGGIGTLIEPFLNEKPKKKG